MNSTIHDEKERRCRLEDSFSFPENQRKYPDDSYVLEHEKEVIERWHLKNAKEEWDRIAKTGNH
jgi:hypothetical protein